MVTIRELLFLNKLKNFKLIAGADGLDNMVSNIVIYEYEQSKQETENFYKGDFIISTLIYAKDNPKLAETTILVLLKQGIVGMAIKVVHFNTLPESIIEVANQKKIPIFLFEDTYMEDIIICVSNYIISRKNQYAYENEINDILNYALSPQEISNISEIINPGFQKYMASIYARSLEGDTNREIFPIIRSLSYNNKKKDFIKQFTFIRFKNGLFIIGNFNLSDKELTPAYVKNLFQKLFILLDCSSLQYQIGQSEIINKAEHFDKCIFQSYYANFAGTVMSQDWSYYTDSGIYKFIFPLLKNKTALVYYKSILISIKEYDEENNFCLYDTMLAYAKNNFKISKTAKELYQHPNTIRYRINKIKNIINCKDSCHFEQLIFLIIKMKEIMQIMEI